jgi:antitoxin component of MazEF toxin-antitoxin module
MKTEIKSKVFTLGNSTVITIPKNWMTWNKVSVGDTISVTLEKEEDNNDTKGKEVSAMFQEDNIADDRKPPKL